MLSKMLCALPLIFVAFQSFAQTKAPPRISTVLAVCTAKGIEEDKSEYGESVLGETSDVTITQNSQMPYINCIKIESKTNFGFNSACLGLPLAHDRAHRSTLIDNEQVFQLSYSSDKDPVGVLDYYQGSKSGTYTTYVAHCEPVFGCKPQRRKFAIRCDREIHAQN